MSSRPPGKLIVLPSARLHWHRERMRRRKMKLVLAGVSLLGLLVALMDVALETTEAPPGEEESSWERGPHPTSGKGASGRGDSERTWFSTTGEP
ncbi:hypothetical protein [Cystobacter ferrugineus]|uniref:Uncharacterized protein n=1 Tax=Cystobacter ferrugineus TaxID=83449 RepID=A0A1L9B2N9_9BACT|nr:hypothetical protein [Cystobacter ferrugineus]OJH36519.1 hypothetical protein BON30_32700 [Cystobacter ferrugineus]